MTPNIFFRYGEERIDESIKEILSKAEYTELSIDENKLEKIPEIVDIMFDKIKPP